MPIDTSDYPPNWSEIAFQVKQRAHWICEKCGKQCILPGQDTSHMSRSERAKYTLTVSHKNHIKMDCRLENLQAYCAPCHLRYDIDHHIANAARTRQARKVGLTMPLPLGE